MKKGRKYSFRALKIDMKKFYDRVRWKFMKAVLMAMNFDKKMDQMDYGVCDYCLVYYSCQW